MNIRTWLNTMDEDGVRVWDFILVPLFAIIISLIPLLLIQNKTP